MLSTFKTTHDGKGIHVAILRYKFERPLLKQERLDITTFNETCLSIL